MWQKFLSLPDPVTLWGGLILAFAIALFWRPLNRRRAEGTALICWALATETSDAVITRGWRSFGAEFGAFGLVFGALVLISKIRRRKAE